MVSRAGLVAVEPIERTQVIDFAFATIVLARQRPPTGLVAASVYPDSRTQTPQPHDSQMKVITSNRVTPTKNTPPAPTKRFQCSAAARSKPKN